MKSTMVKGSALDEKGRYNNIKAQILLQQAYETEYDLYNHQDPVLSHPFRNHLMTDKKRLKLNGEMRRLMRQYHTLNIRKYFGISLLEFLNLPGDRYDDLITVVITIIEQEQADLDKHGLSKSDMRELEHEESMS